MKLTIDVRAANSGLGTYIDQLTKHLRVDRQYICRPDQLAKYPGTVSTAPIYSFQEQWQLPRLCRTEVLHVPHYNGPIFFKGKLIVTIHDVIHLQEPAHRWKALAYAWPMLLAVSRRADRLITVSELSKRAIVEHLRINEDRIEVIHNGVSKQDPTVHGRRDFLLFVGNLKPSKNLPTLFKAMELMPHRTLKVVGAGGSIPNAPKNVEFLGRVDSLEALYRTAAVTVLPSRFEGFCLPILEALSFGCPVACSNFLQEVGGPAAQYFDPMSPAEIVAAVSRATYDPETPKWLARFSWEECARKHEAVYASLGVQ